MELVSKVTLADISDKRKSSWNSLQPWKWGRPGWIGRNCVCEHLVLMTPVCDVADMHVRSQSQSRHYMNQKIPRTSKYPLLHTRSEPEGKWKMPLLLWSHESHTPASKVHVTLQIKQGCPGDRGCCLSIFPEQS